MKDKKEKKLTSTEDPCDQCCTENPCEMTQSFTTVGELWDQAIENFFSDKQFLNKITQVKLYICQERKKYKRVYVNGSIIFLLIG